MLPGRDAPTASEQPIAKLAAPGDSNRDIAQALFITPKTVENHLRRIYEKLATNSRDHPPTVLAAEQPPDPVPHAQRTMLAEHFQSTKHGLSEERGRSSRGFRSDQTEDESRSQRDPARAATERERRAVHNTRADHQASQSSSESRQRRRSRGLRLHPQTPRRLRAGSAGAQRADSEPVAALHRALVLSAMLDSRSKAS
jgi:Bacterial regulatory proteins, luxR family